MRSPSSRSFATGRRLFGRMTLWLMVAIVGGLTIALAALAVRLGVGLPADDSTCLPGSRGLQRATGSCSGFRPPAPCSSWPQRRPRSSRGPASSRLALVDAGDDGLLPRRLGQENRFLVAHWGVIAILGVAAAMIVASGGDEQRLVQFYAVSVFASFLAATVGCARLSLRDGRASAAAVNLLGATLVAAVLALNLTRLDALVALLASARWPSTSIAHGSDGAAPPGGRRRGLSAGATSTASSRSAPCTGTRRPPRRTVANAQAPLASSFGVV